MKIFYGLIVAFFVVFISYFISHAVNDTKKKRETAVEEAIRAGHAVTAELVKCRAAREMLTEFSSSMGIYRYKYKGKSYKYRFIADNPPSTLKLYFVKNPRKATVAESLSTKERNWPVIYIVVAAVLYLLIFR